MTVESNRTGTQIALTLPISSQSAQTDAIVPTTIADLLERLEEAGTKGMPMLRTACGVLATFLSTSTDCLTIQAVFDAKDLFRKYLDGRKYAENSIRTYVNQAKILLKAAKKFGWAPTESVPADWKPVMDRAGKTAIRKSLVKYLMVTRPTPLEVAPEDLDRWRDGKVKDGFSMVHTSQTVSWLWKTLNKLGRADVKHRATKYQVPVTEFPSRLKSEALELLKWKQAEFSPGRPSDGQHRPISALALKNTICQIYGYALHVKRDTEIKCLADLAQEQIVTGFVEWRINERHTGGYAVRLGLAMLRAALRHHPAYCKIDLTWCDRLLESVPLESESARRMRKAEKFLDYSVLERIPGQIRQGRLKLRNSSDKLSQLVMQELLMQWLLVLPWRQRNIRECRVSGPEPNLFKGSIPAFSELTKPDWVLKEEQVNPAAQFWQFRFRSQETKTSIEIHSLLPKQLVHLLEEYLAEHRPHLLCGNYCDALFVNRRGAPIDAILMAQTVRELTLRYAGRQITPHRFRDIIAYAWLQDHPDDYLRLSKLLWHRNVNTTIQIYGARFNESSGVCAMEGWLDEREKKAK